MSLDMASPNGGMAMNQGGRDDAEAESADPAARSRAVGAPGSNREDGGRYLGIPQIPVNRRTSRLSSTRCPRNPGRYRGIVYHAACWRRRRRLLRKAAR